MRIKGPGFYIMANGNSVLITGWVPVEGHIDGGHWAGIVDPSLVTLRAPFNSWTAEGKDCDGYHAWDIVEQEDKA